MNNKTINLKNTLNLPKTDFPMKASLPTREPKMLKEWENEDIYKKILEDRKYSPLFMLHDGPPYANGHIHMGHALNKILKDIVVKYKTLNGYKCPYIPGWDCHGLPIEHQLLKEMNKTKHDVDPIEFRKDAKKYALKWVNKQKKEFQRLGIFGEWDKPYLTLDYGYEVSILEALRDINRNGHMYKSKRPVLWCPSDETALAEAEVEYENHVSPQVYVKFQLKERENTFLVIWTTTPWTLPANLAIAVHKDYTYVEVKCDEVNYIVAKDLVESFTQTAGLDSYEVIQEVGGEQMEGWDYFHPFIERCSKVILSEFVTLDTGSGLVHTAPGHGHEDYIVGLRYGLEVFSPVDEKGCFTKEAGVFEGENVFKANPKVIELLKEKGALIFSGTVEHSYPHSWRSKVPVIFRATEQWFISMDKKNLRQKALQGIEKVNWVPEVGYGRIKSMVEGRPDWCISRQRLWGVPIPALKCSDCGETFFNDEFSEALIQSVKNVGINIWYEKEISEIYGGEVKCTKCESSQLVKDNHIVDVWFESGVSSLAVVNKRCGHSKPSDLYLEGSDQHRGWFQSSLLAASALDRRPPFRAVLTHGFVVDGQGKKMSKSLGNVVDPLDILKRYGADILRLWVAFGDFSVDLKLSEDHFAQISDAYRKVRNTFRFLLGNLNGFKLEEALDFSELDFLDKWIVDKTNKLVEDVTKDMESYRFYRAWQKIFQFCTTDVSALYFNISKDPLYCYHPESKERKSIQTALYKLLNTLVRLVSPFIPFTSEEVWTKCKEAFEVKGDSDCNSVFVLSWPEINEVEAKSYNMDMEKLFLLREDVLKQIELLVTNKQIKSSTQVTVKISTTEKEHAELQKISKQLKRLFIVAEVKIETHSDKSLMEPNVEVSLMNGEKCNRCWITYKPEDSLTEYPGICSDCGNVVRMLEA